MAILEKYSELLKIIQYTYPLPVLCFKSKYKMKLSLFLEFQIRSQISVYCVFSKLDFYSENIQIK